VVAIVTRLSLSLHAGGLKVAYKAEHLGMRSQGSVDVLAAAGGAARVP
jgi:hypothetical protein